MGEEDLALPLQIFDKGLERNTHLYSLLFGFVMGEHHNLDGPLLRSGSMDPGTHQAGPHRGGAHESGRGHNGSCPSVRMARGHP